MTKYVRYPRNDPRRNDPTVFLPHGSKVTVVKNFYHCAEVRREVDSVVSGDVLNLSGHIVPHEFLVDTKPED